jgi:hypothetical protein
MFVEQSNIFIIIYFMLTLWLLAKVVDKIDSGWEKQIDQYSSLWIQVNDYRVSQGLWPS